MEGFQRVESELTTFALELEDALAELVDDKRAQSEAVRDHVRRALASVDTNWSAICGNYAKLRLQCL